MSTSTEKRTTTEARPPRRERLSRGILRAWAWIGAALSALAPAAVIGIQPKPAAGAAPPVVVRRVIRRVVIQPIIEEVPPEVVYVGGSSSGGAVSVSSAPAPAPISSGGS